MRRHTGHLIYEYRKKKGITAKQLCAGVCTPSIISDYENAERIPDVLQLSYFLERLGIASENFAIMVTNDEYEYFEWRKRTEQSLINQEWDVLESLLQKGNIPRIKTSVKLQKQYEYYLKGIIHLKKYLEIADAIKCFKQSIEQTVIDIHHIEMKKVLLGSFELHIVILYLYYGLKSREIGTTEAERIFEALEKYISNEKIDVSEQAKIYPRLIVIWLTTIGHLLTLSQKIKLCENAIRILQETKTFYDITDLLHIYIKLLDEKKDSRVNWYEKHLEVFIQLLEQGGQKAEFCPEIRNGENHKLYLLTEYLISERVKNGMTQECVSDGICAVETYSRIENGIHDPNKKNRYQLIERLEIGWCYIRSELDTECLEAYELRRQHRIAVVEERWKDSCLILEKMESMIDMEKVTNIQYVECGKVIARNRLGDLSENEAYKELQRLLKLSNPIIYASSDIVYYSQIELEIIGYMAQLLRIEGRCEEGIEILEIILNNSKQGKGSIEKQWFGYDFVLRMLSELYFAVGKYAESYDIEKYVFNANIQKREAGNFPTILDSMADDLEHIGVQYSEKYKKLYRQTYYVSDFFGYSKIRDFTKQYYENKFGIILQ